MRLETHMLRELYATRYSGKDPKYALVISHGFAAHGGIYDAFCTYYAKNKVRTFGVTMLWAMENQRAALGRAVSR